jgi:predicted dehydrogenase
MLRIGIAGIGFMGMVHYLSYGRVRGAKVAAICSSSAKKRKGDWRGIQGNFGPPGEQMDLGDVKVYERFEELLGDPDVDVVDVTLPPSQHADAAIQALRAGKHVFCEKPLTLDAASSRRVVKTAEGCGRQLLVGHVLPFFPEYKWARKLIEGGKYGKLRGGSFRRVVSDPAWLKDYWKPDVVGGPMLDLHVHDAHFIRLLFGMPKAVTTQGRMRGPCAESWMTLFQFDDPDLVVSAQSGTIDQQGRPFTHGFEIQLERATLAFEFAVVGGEAGYLCQPTLFGPRGKVDRPELGSGDPMDAFPEQLKEVVRSIRTGAPSAILSGQLAADAITLCHLQTKSLQQGKTVRS